MKKEMPEMVRTEKTYDKEMEQAIELHEKLDKLQGYTDKHAWPKFLVEYYNEKYGKVKEVEEEKGEEKLYNLFTN